MEIKAKVCKNDNIQCTCCLQNKDNVLDIFDIRIPQGDGSIILRLCDNCIDKLFIKTLRCTCYTNARLKNKQDLLIRNKRRQKEKIDKYGDTYFPMNPPEMSTKNNIDDEWEKVISEYEDN